MLSSRLTPCVDNIIEVVYGFHSSLYSAFFKCIGGNGNTVVQYIRDVWGVVVFMVMNRETVKQSRYRPWSGPEGSRKLRFPDFMTTAQGGGKVVSLTHRPHLPPGFSPGTHFC